jgi:hypothetical protein
VLREDGTTLAIVPDTDVLGKWAAETLAALMSGRDAACAGWQAAELELARLRAELARLAPLAEAAVAWMASNSDESRDASSKLKLAAAAYARAQAQDGAA